MSTLANTAVKNHLLANLPEEDYQRLLPHLEPVTLAHGQVLYEIEEPIDYFYFPFNAVISLVTQMEDGRIVEVGLVGNEGVAGLAAVLGQKVSAERAIVQIPNSGVRAKAAVVIDEFKRHGKLHELFLTYANSLDAPDHPNCRLQRFTHRRRASFALVANVPRSRQL